MTLNLTIPQHAHTDFTPRITVIGVGGGGTNAVDNMIAMDLQGVEFVVANTDAQQLMHSRSDRRVQLGPHLTQGLGAGAKPEIGRAAAEEAADTGIAELQQYVDTLIVIPNQNLFRLANERTGWKEAFKMADHVLYMGVRGVTDLMVSPGLVNLDFADIRTVMAEMGKAMMGTGEADGENRAIRAAEAAISNPLLEDTSMAGARGLLINITGGDDMTLFEVDQAANRIREEVADDANIIFGSAIDETLSGRIRVSVVATGIDLAPPIEAGRPRLVAMAGAAHAEPIQHAPANAGAPVLPQAAGQSGPVSMSLGGGGSRLMAVDMAPGGAGVGMGADHGHFAALPAGRAAAAHRTAAVRVAAPYQELSRPVAETDEDSAPQAAATGAVPGQAYSQAPLQRLFNVVTGLTGRHAPRAPAQAEPQRAEPSFPVHQAGPAASVAAPHQEDRLDIPAFLRRQQS